MKVLARPTPRPPASRAKVLLIREPPKSVRPEDQPDPTPLRLAIGTLSAVGGIGLLWLLGMLGYRLGYAPAVRVPELLGDAGGGLATAALMLIRVPTVIVEAGLASPVGLSLAFAVLVIPAAGISAARPVQRGGPRPSSLARVFGALGAVGGGLHLLLVIWWTASPQRLGLLRPIPGDPAEGAAWIIDLETVAGYDAMLLIATALWAVLALRLPIALWLRALTACGTIFALVIAAVAMAVSNAAVAHVTSGHSVGIVEPGDGRRGLVLGSTREHLALLRIEEGFAVVELRERPVGLNVLEERTIGAFLEGE
jgi:hypothetical protein